MHTCSTCHLYGRLTASVGPPIPSGIGLWVTLTFFLLTHFFCHKHALPLRVGSQRWDLYASFTCLKEPIENFSGGGGRKCLSTSWKQTTSPPLLSARFPPLNPSLEPISHRFEMLGWVGEEVTGVGWEFGESFIPCISKAVRLLRGGNDW